MRLPFDHCRRIVRLQIVGRLERSDGARLGASALLALALTTGACGQDLPLEGRACPCVAGWVCCAATERCVSDVVECGPSAGMSELTLVVGEPGGTGTADGVGDQARFNEPERIVGDERYLYVTDGWAQVSTGYCNVDTCDWDLDCVREECWPSMLPPYGIRRIERSTAEVTWLVTELAARHLTHDPSGLIASASKLVLLPTMHLGVVVTPRREARLVVKIDPTTGAVSPIAGIDFSGRIGLIHPAAG
jgi:hypothetical protein